MEVSREEEFWNALTHFIGLLGSIIGVSYLLFTNDVLPILSLSGILFFGFGLVSVYLSSTLYHYVSEPVLKGKIKNI
jgi:hemolysin III